MYWLLSPTKQANIRDKVQKLVSELSMVTDNNHDDQLFPFVGRKDRKKAVKVISNLSAVNELVVDPFSGSGIFSYASAEADRDFLSNEWEPYTNRMSNAPWRIPDKSLLDESCADLYSSIQTYFNYLYKTKCICGADHVLDSLFFDRQPLSYTNITTHERLGPNGENVTYRRVHKCPTCGCKEKKFDASDLLHINALLQIPLDPIYSNQWFSARLIENSRINLNSTFTDYKNLFPHRSLLALSSLWNGIQGLTCDTKVKMFLEDTFLSILPQAKYKDYRSKSQDLHCPDVQLREVNLLYRFKEQIKIRFERLSTYTFLSQLPDTSIKIKCEDFRSFLNNIPNDSVKLMLTDPPWTDGNAYFEKAQLYHPWINYSLSTDHLRLDNEFVVTDAPSRRAQHNLTRWWLDLREFFDRSYYVLCDDAFMALFFRPIPASNWLYNLNRIKLVARQAGFEPLLSIDVGSSDPSMRIQQSAAYVFSTDVVMLFLKLDSSIRRTFQDDFDVDQIVYQVAEGLQEETRGPFTKTEWRSRIGQKFIDLNISKLNQPLFEPMLSNLFDRYCDQVSHGLYLNKPLTPFSGHLFDLPAIERLFTYVPHIIEDLTTGGKSFNYDHFLLSLATYVENGSRALISQIQSVDMKALIEVYAEPHDNGRYFRRRPLPTLPEGIKNVIELDPYAFEAFVAKLLEAQGFTQVGLLGRSGDRGIDVIGRDTSNKLTVVQCKRYITNNVSAEPIQRLHSFAITRSAERMIVITTSDFTPHARDEASHTGVELVNGITLLTLIATYMPEWGKD